MGPRRRRELDDAGAETASRAFSAPGSHPVSLRVTDDRGAADVVTRRVLVRGPKGGK